LASPPPKHHAACESSDQAQHHEDSNNNDASFERDVETLDAKRIGVREFEPATDKLTR
jgi:hypothetical protein